MDYYRGFQKGIWQEEINLRDFIALNFTPYAGNADFLAGTTPRTDSLKDEVNRLLSLENEKGGVLNVDTEKASSLLTFKPGYVKKDEERHQQGAF